MALPGVCDDPVIVGSGIHEVALAHKSALAGGRRVAVPDGELIRSEFSSPGRR